MESSNIAALLLILVAGQGAILAEGSNECESYGYVYTLQPPEATACSPYVRGILNLTCAVSGELVDDIQWFFRPSDGTRAMVLTNSSQVTITPLEFDSVYSRVMTITDLTSANEGFYWCQGLIQHKDHTLELSRSDQFELLPEAGYFPFICPENKALKSSNVRCAAVLPRPIITTSLVPTISLMPTTTMEVPPFTVEQPHSLTMSLSNLPTVHTTTTISVRVTPTSKPTLTDHDNTSGGTTDPPPTDTETDTESDSTTVPPLDQGTTQLSDIILYAILGLLGCLVVLVFSLTIVISILCYKKRRSSIEGKDARYDQFSTESDAPHGAVILKSLDSTLLVPPPPPPYRLPLPNSHSDTTTSSSSGIYDEICLSMLDAHHYQEIPAIQENATVNDEVRIVEALPGGEASALNSALGGESEGDATQELNFENPYDLPDHLISPVHAQATVGPVSQHGTSPSSDITVSSHHHGYHSLEQPSILIEQVDARSSMGDSSEFTNSNLQVTPPPETLTIKNRLAASASSSSNDTVAVDLEIVVPHVDIVIDPSEEDESTPVSAIPEHPYHVLEERLVQSAESQNGSQSDRDQSCDEAAPPPQILRRVSLSEDEGYDRLVGPPHIYHILQKSPSFARPQFRECSPTSGYHRLDNRMESGVQGPPQGALCLNTTPPLSDNPLPNEEESLSVISDSELFDDPLYNFSPKRALNGDPPTQSHCNGHSDEVEKTTVKTTVDKAGNLSKYRGDYERDPTYMERIQKRTEVSTTPSDELSKENSDHTDVCVHIKDTCSSDHTASLPDKTHTYQSLQTLTRDPLRNYEMLQKCQLTVDPINV